MLKKFWKPLLATSSIITVAPIAIACNNTSNNGNPDKDNNTPTPAPVVPPAPTPDPKPTPAPNPVTPPTPTPDPVIKNIEELKTRALTLMDDIKNKKFSEIPAALKEMAPLIKEIRDYYKDNPEEFREFTKLVLEKIANKAVKKAIEKFFDKYLNGKDN
ncbi:hypothetical protein MCSF7_00391 [Mycoplasmopsis columbina SF7]|uniref:Lipoprotein n=1 Tax=Mycoplasmopsis columbina SF7 TaxID=1037410 RepID=F9UJN2_9BACT|nr:hypothetical protein [Mycoplasmopsis columbina]EGV00413.1 hypothetical protein MCSF7_00391 [Mycoplasmopsis columbina SF7]